MNIAPAPVDKQQTYGDSVFPYALVCSEPGATLAAAADWVGEHRDEILRLANQYGAVLLRDFPVENAEGFDAIIQSLRLENFPYKKSLSNAVRINRTDRVFSANEAPPEVRIFFHHEMAQTPLFPKWIMFSCEIAADQGGATPICRSDVLWQRLAAECPEFAEACEKKGLTYSNVMPNDDDAKSGMGRSWRSTLGVTDREGAEARLRELNYSWEWLEGDSLRATTPPLPAVKDLGEGRKSFFNQMIAAYCGWKDPSNDPSGAIRHADGTPLDGDAVRRAAQLAEELAFDLEWQVGDVVILDNTVAMHARSPFVGTRKVVASLAEMNTHSFTVTV
ncbi:TauD/TfdA family dioxygenase [Rosistilla oblonga]|uniref:Taurine catabolism dioxygenase TauD, TfdA family n=1 Tax=Rosistilla oblonga TaxID=2527990 RepID=A0A518IVM6_9BACT|nr:TauD/TfdA family dioxygenase [Rosistilla oblonga]QDV57142.1 Taurine catabolism dioxygenase TauD, TfdA family [Rosistilla oblonga]